MIVLGDPIVDKPITDSEDIFFSRPAWLSSADSSTRRTASSGVARSRCRTGSRSMFSPGESSRHGRRRRICHCSTKQVRRSPTGVAGARRRRTAEGLRSPR